jgi:hypothetical protein
MSYLVFCTFDLKNATSQHYQNANSDLEKLGLRKVVVASGGNSIVIPTTAAMGQFNGTAAASVRDEMVELVQNAFRARAFKAEVFLVVGDNWAWGSATT